MRASLTTLTICVLSAIRSASAEVPPLPGDEMLQRSDVVVDGKSLELKCDGVVSSTDETKTVYVAKVQVISTIKGTPAPVITVEGAVVRESRIGAGPSQVPPLPTGWVGRLYLRGAEGQRYKGTWHGYSAVEKLGESAPAGLPACSVVTADGGAVDGSVAPIDASYPMVDAGSGPQDAGRATDVAPLVDAGKADGKNSGGCSVAPRGHFPGGFVWIAVGLVACARRRRNPASGRRTAT